MWRAKKAAACERPSGQAKYCLSAPPFYLPSAHLYCPWSHIGTLQSLLTGWGIYGGAIRVISSTGKQWPTLVGFDSVHSKAGVNGTQQKSTPTTQWCLSLSAKVTSNKHCKQGGGWCGGGGRGGAKRRHRIKGLVSAQRRCITSLVGSDTTTASTERRASCMAQKENNCHLLHVTTDIYNEKGLARTVSRFLCYYLNYTS